jgi:hypothetical protein
MFVPPRWRQQVIALGERIGLPPSICDKALQARFCEEFLGLLTNGNVQSVDANNYEGASCIWDMNIPLPGGHFLLGAADWVLDIGTSEHIFDVRQSISNIIGMLRPGGSWIADLPSNQINGHGFYQFGPTLPYSLVKSCPPLTFLHNPILRESVHRVDNWRVLPRPSEAIGRLNAQSTDGTMMSFAITKQSPVEQLPPIQQYDYADLSWAGQNNSDAVSPRAGFEGPVPRSRTLLKLAVKDWCDRLYYRNFVAPYLAKRGLRRIDSFSRMSAAELIGDQAE